MNGFSDWFDNNGVDLARLLVQCGILASVVWYSRKILRSMRVSQEQLGALLRLSVSDTAHDHRSPIEEPALAPPGFADPPYAPKQEPVPMAASTGSSGNGAHLPGFAPGREQSLGGRVVAERIAVREPEPAPTNSVLTPWVAAPVGDTDRAENLATSMAEGTKNLSRWLGEAPRPKRGNPLSKVFRWLQAPAGSKAPARS